MIAHATRDAVRARTPEEFRHALARLGEKPDVAQCRHILRHAYLVESEEVAVLAGRHGVMDLLENPRFSRRLHEVVSAWLAAMRVKSSEFERDRVMDALAALAERGLLTPRELQRILPFAWAIHDLALIAARESVTKNLHRFPFSTAQLLWLVRKRGAAFSDKNATLVVTHPSADASVWRAMLGTGYMNLRALSMSRGARTDEVVRARLMEEEWETTIRTGLCLEAQGEEFARLWTGLLDLSEREAARLLGEVTPAQLAWIPRDHLLPLLESSHRESRLAAVAAVSHVGQGL